MNIGFLGMGIMGSRMAMNLVKAGHVLRVYNRSAYKCEPLVKAGAHLCRQPSEVATGSEVVITMLADPDAVEAVAFGENGFFDDLEQNALWIDCSTVGPKYTHALAQRAREANSRFLEAPVSGSKNPAESGELTFLVGGEPDVVTSAEALFDIMGTKTVHVGAHGSAGALKLVLNHLLGTTMAAFAEGMALGESLGLPKEQLFTILTNSPLVPPYLSIKKAKILDHELEADFPLKWMNKDLALVSAAAYESGTAMPLANSAKELYRLAQNNGHADHDFAAIYHFLSRQEK